MEELWSFVEGNLLPHWPFFSWMIIAMLLGQVAKNALWTKKAASSKKPHWFWWWMRKTMALHPVVAGAIVGLIWNSPEEGVDGVAAIGYFALSGALSTWAYEFLRGMAKKRGMDLSLPGLTPSSPPTSPKPPPPPPGR